MYIENFDLIAQPRTGIMQGQSTQETIHVSVLLNEVLEWIQADRAGQYLDCTLGGGGHTQAILSANQQNQVTACDRDLRAIERSRKRLESFSDRVKLVHSAFADLQTHLSAQKFDGVLADLGLSSDQLAEGRGFSFEDQSELDMRMDQSCGQTAQELLNVSSEQDLYRILREGGLGSEARTISRAIVSQRPFRSAQQLAQTIAALGLAKHKEKHTHPATLVFQALRIAVNSEFEQIDSLLEAAPTLLRSGGRLLIISFHSLEDKRVARCMRDWESDGYPALWPANPRERQDSVQRGRLLTHKAIVPSESELNQNPRARSARMRVFEFL